MKGDKSPRMSFTSHCVADIFVADMVVADIVWPIWFLAVADMVVRGR